MGAPVGESGRVAGSVKNEPYREVNDRSWVAGEAAGAPAGRPSQWELSGKGTALAGAAVIAAGAGRG